MKNRILIFSMFLFGAVSFGQNKNAKATIEVDGVCEMCKERIEKASVQAKGVKMATWNVSTHQLDLVYNEKRTDLSTIKQSIANSGHDTDEVKANQDAYESLHSCCLYRDEKVRDDH